MKGTQIDSDSQQYKGIIDRLTRIESALKYAINTFGQILGITFGSGSATWSTATTSADQAITHSLGRTPKVVFIQQINTAAITYGVKSVGSTTFTVTGFYTDHVTMGNLSGTFSFYWLALG